MSDRPALVWLRRDLRLSDNPALAEATRRHDRVLLCFCFERGLTRGPHASPNRNAFLLASLTELERDVREVGGRLVFRDGDPAYEIRALAEEIGAEAVYANRDHTAYSRLRDRRVREALANRGIELVTAEGVACANVAAISTKAGNGYRVFTPFYNAWREAPRRAPELRPRLMKPPRVEVASRVPSQRLLKIDDEAKRIAELAGPGESASRKRLDTYFKRINTYDEARDRPDLDWTSRISAAMHFGCVSARGFEERLMARSGRGRMQLRRQLAWRDFFLHLTHHYPDTLATGHEQRLHGFRWRRDAQSLDAWKLGQTGLPLVDAGMRQLLSEGWMHNRVRMVAASFLVKHLLIDWRLGEAHFMHHLVDGDEASNNGNWQWAASVGADPQPYFRVFNPVRQMQRFDPDAVYIRRWLPELGEYPNEYIAEPWKAPPDVQERSRCFIGEDYPEPIVDLVAARHEAVSRFRAHLARAKP